MALIHSFRLGSPDAATLLALAGLSVQALIFYFIGQGSNAARIVLFVVILLGLLTLLVLRQPIGLIVRNQPISALVSLAGLVLKLSAFVLLFTPTARFWFSRGQVTNGAVDL